MMALNALGAMKRAYDTKQLRDQIARIESTVQALGARIDQILDISVMAAFEHLATADRATNDDFRRQELNLARGKFVEMTKRPTESMAHPGEQDLSAQQVTAIGHAGNFSYFMMNGEVSLALLEAYRCTERFPALGVQLFPKAVFSRDYSATGRAMVARRASRDRVRANHEASLKAHQADRGAYYRELAWKVPAAGAVFLGFLAAGMVAPPLAGQAGARAAGILAGTGDRAISDVPGPKPKLNYDSNAIDPPEEIELMRQASAESAQRRATLERSV
ncbi:hypothetical protein Pa4123_86480 [Phytohabitans aurantiacus]|uniref:Uncharacterized protein n=2 Tax=Phytohabitans aurantiacus TaxID=3016789 RepID=A0ABQ5RAE6_9ACTN|nr:hypothetical protein Pa4123_86480 [Phytohabitans aurantiacus]